MHNIMRLFGLFLLLFLALCMCLTNHPAAGTVVDQLERRVMVPKNPGRVVSLAPSITEIVYALGQEKRLKGVTRYSDFPAEAQKLPRIGSYVRLDIERIVALNPDLCIATKDGNRKEVIYWMEYLRIMVYGQSPQFGYHTGNHTGNRQCFKRPR
jgi:iron complex transport system substrate-binding protein